MNGRSNGFLGCNKPGLVNQAWLCSTAGGVRYANQIGCLQWGRRGRGGEEGEEWEEGRKMGKEDREERRGREEGKYHRHTTA